MLASIFSLNVLQTALELGCIYALVALALFLSYSILNIADLSTDGCFTLGCAVACQVALTGHPILALFAAMAAGVCSGFVTAFLQTRLGVESIMAGIIVNTGLYTINLAVMGFSSTMSLVKTDTVFSLAKGSLSFLGGWYKLAIALAMILLAGAAMLGFLGTRLGLSIRATGDNAAMVRASSINPAFTMIEQCAPVLASLKPAGLFRYETRDCADLARRVKNWNTQLNPKGLRVRVLKGCVLNHRYLVYVYRESKLAAVLADEKVQSFLRQEGYRLPEAGEAPDVGNMLTQLSRKLCCSAEFPHEIGVFLGYPLGDVVGFIENRGKNFTCCGCWKSYGDPDAAQKHFDQLSKCTAVYLRLFHSGTPILRLAVAA